MLALSKDDDDVEEQRRETIMSGAGIESWEVHDRPRRLVKPKPKAKPKGKPKAKPKAKPKSKKKR